MTAMRWERAWRFSIVLAFLLVRHVSTTALSVSTEKPSTSYKSSDDKYNFVDVAQQQGEFFQGDTAQTTRYYTLGDVDESFWLEHLGDDFKNAIHLQVAGEEQCNGVFNMSENGSAYKVQEEPTNDLVLENEVSLPTPDDIKVEKKSKSKTKGESKKSGKMRRKSRPAPKTQIPEEIAATPKSATTTGETGGLVESTSEAYIINEDQSYTEAPYKVDLKKYAKFQHINLKYEPKANTTTQTKNSTLLENTATTNEPIEETPIVVNLPESKKLIELETSDTAVVVKIPPVIYHSEPTAFADPDDYTDNRQTNTHSSTETHAHSPTETHAHSQTETQRHTHPQTQATLPHPAEEPAHTDNRVDNVQYTQYSYPQMTYEQQQHYLQQHLQQAQNKLQSQQHLQQTNFYQPHQQSQYPVQMQQTQYQETSLHDQPEQHEYQQYSKPYISSNYYYGGSSSYHNNGIYPTTPTTVSIHHKPNELESNSNGKYYYMISKRSVGIEKSPAAHEEASAPKTPPKQATSSENSRVTRATEDLYQEGL
ncbi:PREDICTED: TOX high mobility group box family member 3 [Rhagoletis zephyria]|uniref:TOX high mobility group box family member 3 n=1 Tax=Rhagoletis zephyria TaxID=28612 RepID=UPI0008112D53|nr:PREDICTED: TOX high mobility group box family member 3 [Rhagoletis zephyria]